MADYGDYGRRRPRPHRPPSASAGWSDAGARTKASANANLPAAAAGTGVIGQPRIVYRGRVSSSSGMNTGHRGSAEVGRSGKDGGSGKDRARSAGRSHPWDRDARNINSGNINSSSSSSGKLATIGGDEKGRAGGASSGGNPTDARANVNNTRDGDARRLAAIRSASPYAPRSGLAARAGGSSFGGSGSDDLLATVGIQLSDRQRQLMERRRGNGGGSSGGPGSGTADGAAGDNDEGTAMGGVSTDGTAEDTDAKVQSKVRKPKSKPSRASGRKASPKKSRGKSQSPTRMGRSRSNSANASRRSLTEVDGNSPMRGGGISGGRRSISPKKKPSSSSLSSSRSKSNSKSKLASPMRMQRTSSSTSTATSSAQGIVPASASTSSSSLGLSRSKSVGATRPPSHGGGLGGGGRDATNSNATAPTTTNNTPPRPRLTRSASSSSRRSALGNLDGNSPKRDGMGIGSKSPKRRPSKSPLRRSGSSASVSAAALRRSKSAGRGSAIGGARDMASASASASVSTSALVVHEDATATSTKEEATKTTEPAAVVLPPKVSGRAAAATAPSRGILRPPVYSKADGTDNSITSSDAPTQSKNALTDSEPVGAAAPAEPTPSAAVGDNATDSDDEVDDGFNDFMNELMEEVALDHTELWAGFQSTFGVSPRSMRPLHTSADLPAANAKAQKKRLGPKAQETLSTIHRGLLEHGPADNYAGKAQLANDRKIAKERRARQKKQSKPASTTAVAAAAMPGPASVPSSSSLGPLQDQGEPRIQFAGRTPAPPRRPQHEQVQSSRVQFAGRTPAPPRRAREEDDDENASDDVGTTQTQSPREAAVPTPSLQTPAPAKSFTAAATPAPPPATSQEPPWLVKLRERQRKIKEEQPDSPLATSPTASVEKDPIEKLFGKRVVSTCKKRTADAAYEDSTSAVGDGSATPWKLKLRSTPAQPKQEQGTPWQVKLRATPAKARGANDSADVEAKAEAVPFAIGLKKTGFFEKKAIHDPYSKRVADPEEQWNPSEKAVPMTTVKRPDGTYKVHTQSYLNSSQPSYLLQRQPWLKPSELKPVRESKDKPNMPVSPSHNLGITFGDTVHLNDLPVEVFGLQDESTSVQLCSADDEPTSVVIVGKDAVVKATSKTPANDEEGPASGTDEATIAWCWHRADIRSLTLNNEATCAELALKRRSKLSLSFNSAEDCMLFAQAFYKLKVHVPIEESAATDNAETGTVEDANAGADAEQIESSGTEESSSSPDPPTDETEAASSLTTPPTKEDPPEDLKNEESEKGASIPTSISAAPTLAVAPTEGSSKTGGRVLTEEEEFVLKQYHEGVITASSVAASCAVPSDADTSASTLQSNNANSNPSGPADPRAAVLAAIKGGSGGVKSKMAKFDKLSEEDEKIATKYRKMLSMGVPPPAVEHAMKRDQVSDKIVNIILNSGEAPEGPALEEIGGSTPSSDGTSNLSEEEQEVAAKYQKMLKVSIPREAVRHKMIRDSISEKIRIAVLGPDADKATKSSGLTLSLADEQIAAQYRKMLKISIPRDAVRNKMMRDNVGVKIIEAVLGKGATAKADSDVVAIVLTKEEEAVAAQYRKMIRFNIPKDAVRHKMMKDNVDARVIIAVVGDDDGPGTAKKKKKNNNMVALHWTPLSPSALENSVWRTTKKRKLSATAIHDGSDVKKLEELFQKKTTKAGTKGPGDAATEGDGKVMAKLIDLNRANIIAISLKAFQDFTHKELADTIANLDPDTKIVGERVQFLTGLLPNQTEVAAVKSYKGSDDRLVPAELFFKQLLSVPRLQTKVHVIQTMATFSDSAKETGSKFQLLKAVCSQVMESTKLQQVLEMVLHIGNLMNEGTRTGDIDGFKFDSLLKLTQTKSQDGKLTVLDYIVTTFIEKNDRAVLDIGSDFPECETAGRILISDLVSDARGLRMGLNKCRTELTEMKKDQSTRPVTRSQARKFAEEPSKPPLDPRAGLLAAIKARGTEDEGETAQKPADPRAAMLAAIKSRGGEADGNDKNGEEQQQPKQDFSPGVLRLESFLADATSDLEALDKTKSSAVQGCKDLSLYFGEGGSEKSAAPLLSVLSTFCKSIDNAVKGYEKRKASEEKKKAAAEKKASAKGKTPSKPAAAPERSRKGEITRNSKSQEGEPNNDIAEECKSCGVIESRKPISSACSVVADNGANAPVDSKPNANNGKSLVLMVNEMLQTASPRTKREYREGVRLKHPHTRQLKDIYQKEEDQAHVEEETIVAEPHTPAPTTPPFAADPRAAMLSAIQSRRLDLESPQPESKPSPLDPRAVMLSAIKSRQNATQTPKPEPQPSLEDPRAAMLSAIKARKK